MELMFTIMELFVPEKKTAQFFGSIHFIMKQSVHQGAISSDNVSLPGLSLPEKHVLP